jgi:hypothetical protein
MFATTARTLTAEQVSQAFKALGILEGLASPSRDLDPAALGDTLAEVLHAAAREAPRRERRIEATRAHRRTMQAARRGELVLLNECADAALYATVA